MACQVDILVFWARHAIDAYIQPPGIMRNFLVYPTFAVYPQLMPSVQLFDTLHRGKEAVMQKKRLRFFWIIFIGIFVWEWFPVCELLFNQRFCLTWNSLRNTLRRACLVLTFSPRLSSFILSKNPDGYQHILFGKPEECMVYSNFWYVHHRHKTMTMSWCQCRWCGW